MQLVVEVQVGNVTGGQARDIKANITDALMGLGFRIDEFEYTPASSTLAELTDVQNRHARLKTYQA